MTAPPPRKRFQIHLSTAIVMVFVAGALIWLNTIPTHFLNQGGRLFLILERGWPFYAASEGGYTTIEHYTVIIGESTWLFHWSGVIYDFTIALTILSAVWFLCEWLISRRAARKGS